MFCLYLVSLCSLLNGAEVNNTILMKAASELERQNQAWDDLSIKYNCEEWIPDSKEQWKLNHSLLLRWSVAQSGWEKILRARSGNSWTEAASFDGEYYMTYDSQHEGSAGFGHRISPFLNISDSPKIFGLFVTGLELGQPVSVAEFLKMESAHVKVLKQANNLLIVEGDDPLAVGVRLKLTLDSNFGYRPIKIEVRDDRGLLSTYKDIEYEQFAAKRGTFWFPRKGSWHGVNPEDRSTGARMDYSLTNMVIDQNPVKEDFQLTYPTGTLLLNTDSGVTTYAAAEVSLQDLIGDTNKIISMEEHDRLAQNIELISNNEEGNATRFTFVLVNLLLIVIVILAALFIKFRSRKSL